MDASNRKVYIPMFIFVAAELGRMYGLFIAESYIQVQEMCGLLSIFELAAGILMAKRMLELLRKTKKREYYIPMAAYFLYGISFLVISMLMEFRIAGMSGVDVFLYYKLFQVLAEAFIGWKLLSLGRRKQGMILSVGSLLHGLLIYGQYMVPMLYHTPFAVKGLAAAGFMVFASGLHLLAAREILWLYEAEEEETERRTGHQAAILVCVIITGVMIYGCGFAEIRDARQPVPPAGNLDFEAGDRTLEERIGDYLDAACGDMNGEIRISVGDVTVSKSYGENREQYNLCGISRQITAAAVLTLADQGKISLGATVDQYLPEYRYGSSMTVAQLLNQTAAVPDYASRMDIANMVAPYLYGRDAMALVMNTDLRVDILKLLNSCELEEEPGAAYEHSRSHYYLLALLVEAVSGMDYTEYLEERFFEPYGITGIELGGSVEEVGGDIYYAPTLFYGDNCLVGTAEGIQAWNRLLVSGQLFSEETEQVMLEKDLMSGDGCSIKKLGEGNYYYISGEFGYVTYQYMEQELDIYASALLKANYNQDIQPLLELNGYIEEYLSHQKGEQ